MNSTSPSSRRKPGPITTNGRGDAKLRLQPGTTFALGGYGSRLSPGRRGSESVSCKLHGLSRFGISILAWLASAAIAHAGGSLGLDEVLTAVAKAPKLVSDIQAELGKANLGAADVTCVGARHGNHWTYLGGGRAAPYECEIGKRTLSIEADRVYFDARGKSLGNLDKADPKRAKTFQESNFRWTWSP